MTPYELVLGLGSCIGLGAMVGAAIALFNSWGT
jgi:hypothetical protein